MLKNKSYIKGLFVFYLCLSSESAFSMMEECDPAEAFIVKKKGALRIVHIKIEGEEFRSRSHKEEGFELYFLEPKGSLSDYRHKTLVYNPSRITLLLEEKLPLKREPSVGFPLLIPFKFIDPCTGEEEGHIAFDSLLSTTAPVSFRTIDELENPENSQFLEVKMQGRYEMCTLMLTLNLLVYDFSRRPVLQFNYITDQAKVYLSLPHPFLRKSFEIEISSTPLRKENTQISHPDCVYYDASLRQFYTGVRQLARTFTVPFEWASAWRLYRADQQRTVLSSDLADFHYDRTPTRDIFFPAPPQTGVYQMVSQKPREFNVILRNSGKIFMAFREPLQLKQKEEYFTTARLSSSCLEISPQMPDTHSFPSGFYAIASEYKLLFLTSDSSEEKSCEIESLYPFPSDEPPTFSMKLDSLGMVPVWNKSFLLFPYLGTLHLEGFQLIEGSPALQMLAQAIGESPSLSKLVLRNCFADFFSSEFFEALKRLKRDHKALRLREFELLDPLSLPQYKELVGYIEALSLIKIRISLPDPKMDEDTTFLKKGAALGVSAGAVIGFGLACGGVFGGSPVVVPALILKGAAGSFITNGIVGTASGGIAGSIIGWRMKREQKTPENLSPVILSALECVLKVPTLKVIQLINPEIQDPSAYKPYIETNKLPHVEVDINDGLKSA